MSRKEVLIEAIGKTIDAMPQRLRGNELAIVIVNLLVSYNMINDADRIADEVKRLIENHVTDLTDEDLQTVSAIRDADQFLARIQDEARQ